MDTAQGIRARTRAALEEEILTVARDHLARHGAAALSLRAIARDLGMVSSALYRYVRSRDDLLTLLIVSAYTSLGEAVEDAHARVDPGDLDARWEVVGRALRSWALANPHEYALLYGSPVPDYHAPPERTNDAGTRVQVLLVRLLMDARVAGRLQPAAYDVDPDRSGSSRAAAAPMLQDPFFEGLDLGPDTLMAGLAAWTLVLGTVSTEIFGQLGDAVPDPDAYFTYMLHLALRIVIAPTPPAELTVSFP